MKPHRITRFAGQFSTANDLATPPGALAVLENAYVTSTGVIRPRRGYDFFGNQFGGPTPIPYQLFWYSSSAGYVFASVNSLGTWQLRAMSTAGVASTISTQGVSPTSATTGTTFTPALSSSIKLRTAETKNSVFMAEDTWVRVLDTEAGVAKIAGCPDALGSYALTADNSGTVGKFLPDSYSVAYRYVWGYRDPNGRVILGAPSGREVFRNGAGGARNASIQVVIPPGITTSHFLQIYRTVSTPTTPGEDYYLTYEQTGLSATDLDTNRYTPAVVDVTPDSVLGPALYTNVSDGDGSVAANNRPPRCVDLCYFDNRMLYANTYGRSTIELTLLAVNPTGATGTVAFANTNTIKFFDGSNTRTYTCSTGAEAIATRTFHMPNTGSPTRDVRETALSLVRCINGNHTDGFTAAYLSADDDSQGQIAIFRNTPAQGDISVTVSANGAAWEPALPTSGTTIASNRDYGYNRIYYSKADQPEAVPALNYVNVGASSKNITRIVALNGRVYVFKEDGVFVLLPTGSEVEPFQVEVYNPNLILRGYNTPVVLDNSLYFLANEGLLRISSGGALKNVSLPLMPELQTLVLSSLASGQLSVYGVGYEEEHRYMLFYSTGANCFAYHSDTESWAIWGVPVNASAAMVLPPSVSDTTLAGRMLLADSSRTRLLKERKSYQNSDYADYSDAFTISSVDSTGTVLTLSATTGTTYGIAPSVYGIVVSGAAVGKITAWDSGTRRLTVSVITGTFAPGAMTYTLSYPVVVYPLAMDFGDPDNVKHVTATTFHFRLAGLYSAEVQFITDFTRALSASTTLSINNRGTAGTAISMSSAPLNKRVLTPSSSARCGYFQPALLINEAGAEWELNGLTVEYEPTSERNST